MIVAHYMLSYTYTCVYTHKAGWKQSRRPPWTMKYVMYQMQVSCLVCLHPCLNCSCTFYRYIFIIPVVIFLLVYVITVHFYLRTGSSLNSSGCYEFYQNPKQAKRTQVMMLIFPERIATHSYDHSIHSKQI